MSHGQLQSKIEEIVSPLCAQRDLELVHVDVLPEPKGAVLRITIDRPRDDGKDGSGVDIDDCQAISHDLSAILDEAEDLVAGAFRLEVGSPGLERPLYKAADYQRFEGREAVIKTREPVEGRRSFRGTLAGFEAGDVRLDVNGQVQSIPLEVVIKAHLVHRF
jgi:ribosome maturation factor RimP